MKENRSWKNIIGIVLLAAGACALAGYMYIVKMQPSGDDVWGHLYKSEVMYENIRQGCWYPIFDFKWYNGIQLYRYWPPFSYYVMAGMLMITGGNLVYAYYLLSVFLFFVGGLPWVLWGNMRDRRVLGTLLGFVWFFMPEISRIYFNAGNLPQMVTTVIVPYVIFFLWLFVSRKNNAASIGLFLAMAVMTFTHLMVTAIMGVATFLYLLLDQIWNKDWKRKLLALCIMVTGILSVGIWILPALKGGIMTSEQGGGSVMASLIFPLSVSLNVVRRLSANVDAQFYFGLSVLILSIAGLLLARGKKKAGFVLPLIILVFTTPATYEFLSKLPFSQLFWMTRFMPMVYGFFFCSLLEWTRLKKKYSVILMAVLVLDLVPSFLIQNYCVFPMKETVADIQSLREMTSQRASVVDISSYGPYPSYGICGDEGVNYTFGWAWQGAVTGDNIVLLNEALENERYLYLFDRCLELGNDTVLIRKNYVGKNGGTKEQMLEAAQTSGYVLAKETDGAYMFKHETPDTFGVVSQYQGIVIGKYANVMTTAYPGFEAGSMEELDSYSYEELKGYKTIFLTGFTYRDKTKAEQLIRKLAESGVRVVIDSTHMPADSKTKLETFLGVTNQQIHFQNRYPALQMNGEDYHTGNFRAEDTDFATGYISRLDHVLGSVQVGTEELAFYGYNDEEPNVYFLGLNLMYHATSTNDQMTFTLLNEILDVSNEQLPVRELVPIKVNRTGNTITIHVEDENVIKEGKAVSTTIADQDIFSSKQKITQRNNLLEVHETDTTIALQYPMFVPGLLLSLFGLLAGILFIRYAFCCSDRKETAMQQSDNIL